MSDVAETLFVVPPGEQGYFVQSPVYLHEFPDGTKFYQSELNAIYYPALEMSWLLHHGLGNPEKRSATSDSDTSSSG